MSKYLLVPFAVWAACLSSACFISHERILVTDGGALSDAASVAPDAGQDAGSDGGAPDAAAFCQPLFPHGGRLGDLASFRSLTEGSWGWTSVLSSDGRSLFLSDLSVSVGRVRAYSLVGDCLTVVGADLAPISGDTELGMSLVTSGDGAIMIAGAQASDGARVLYLYQRIGAAYVLAARLAVEGGSFGAVAMDSAGNRVVAVAQFEGAPHIMTISRAGSDWVVDAVLDINGDFMALDGAFVEMNVTSLALSGDGNTLAVGGQSHISTSNHGAVVLWRREGGSWILGSSDHQTGLGFARALAMDHAGHRLVRATAAVTGEIPLVIYGVENAVIGRTEMTHAIMDGAGAHMIADQSNMVSMSPDGERVSYVYSGGGLATVGVLGRTLDDSGNWSRIGALNIAFTDCIFTHSGVGYAANGFVWGSTAGVGCAPLRLLFRY